MNSGLSGLSVLGLWGTEGLRESQFENESQELPGACTFVILCCIVGFRVLGWSRGCSGLLRFVHSLRYLASARAWESRLC